MRSADIYRELDVLRREFPSKRSLARCEELYSMLDARRLIRPAVLPLAHPGVDTEEPRVGGEA